MGEPSGQCVVVYSQTGLANKKEWRPQLVGEMLDRLSFQVELSVDMISVIKRARDLIAELAERVWLFV